MPDDYQQRLDEANQTVARAAAGLSLDPQRPAYHLMTAANWINDPNGPVYHAGWWHMFFQHNPAIADFGPMSWGHARSRDLAHWEHCPIAIMPTPGSYDGAGCWSGSVVIHDGVPTMLYSAVADMSLYSADEQLPPSDRQRIPQGYYDEFLLEIDQETQCLATSGDELQSWRKHPANPVIGPIPPGLDLIGFRDPFLWREADGAWYMLLGSGIKGRGGAALLYRSADLVEWAYLNPLYIGEPAESGINWECPNFLDLGARHMLVVSPHGRPIYWLGEYAGQRFQPAGPAQRLDWGDAFYAPNSLLDPAGRWLMWGWLREARPRDQYAAAGWASCLTLPRVIRLDARSRLHVEPAPELRKLRVATLFDGDIALKPERPHALGDARGAQLEIACRLTRRDCDSVSLQARRSPDGQQFAEVAYDFGTGRLSLFRESSTETAEISTQPCHCDLSLNEGETLDLRIFLDNSVIEIFANGRSMASRIYPSRADATGLSMSSLGGEAAAAVTVWRMGSIWREQS